MKIECLFFIKIRISNKEISWVNVISNQTSKWMAYWANIYLKSLFVDSVSVLSSFQRLQVDLNERSTIHRCEASAKWLPLSLLNYIWLYLKRTQQFQRTEAFLEVWLMLYFFKFWSAVGTTWVAENNMFLQEKKASFKAKSHIISLQ